ncbi:MAG: exonuclease domain-containing protein [Candidatus Paceibacterota bacterium]|jgi:DNA polymerase III epsilon subunit-like protein
MIILDVEASGVDTNKDSLLSIGAFDIDNSENKFYGECKVWNGAHINDDALAVNGFTKEQATDESKQTDIELVEKFIEWAKTCGEHTFAGQNPSFDRDFIHSSALRGHLDWPFAYRTIDQHSLCFMHMTKRGVTPPVLNNRTDLNSDKIMKYVGIPVEPHPHNALNGAKVAGEAISRLLYDKKLLPEFGKYPIPWLK